MLRPIVFFTLSLLCTLGTSLAKAAEARVAVAANFAAPLAALSAGFAASTGHSLKITSGATGKFYTQVKAGAPFDVLLAADQDTPKRLVDAGLAVAASRFTYAHGRLVLWSASPGRVDAEGAVLGGDSFRHLAIANPKLSPYGRAAMQVLQVRGVHERLKAKMVVGESVAQAYQFIVTGNAEIGFVALSQVQQAGHSKGGSSWLVPAALHETIAQDAVLLKAGINNPAATALLLYLRSDEAQRVLRGFGYE